MNSLQRIMAEAMELDEKERASLAVRLLESLDTESDDGSEDAWRLEIERRLDDLDANPSNTLSWQDVKQRLNDRLGGEQEQPSH